MTERPNFDLESVNTKTSAQRFENSLLRAAFASCVNDPEQDYFSHVSRHGNIHTADGEVMIAFTSDYVAGPGTRNYNLVVSEVETEFISELEPEVRQNLLDEARDMIIEQSWDLEHEDVDEIDVEEGLADDMQWRRLSDPDKHSVIELMIETGWEYNIINGQATKQFFARRYLDGEAMDEANIGEIGGESDSFDPDEDIDMIATLFETTDDISKVEDEDFQAMAELLKKLGLVSQRSVNKYNRNFHA